MAARQKATDAQIAEAYAATGNIWKAADALGMVGQSVHERLVKLGLQTPMNVFTDAEKNILREQYDAAATSGKLDDLAQVMGRTKQFICRQARALGLTDNKRKRPYLIGIAGIAMRQWLMVNEHPRGMLGKKHSEEVCAAVAKAGRERWEAMSQDERDDLTIKQIKARAAKTGKVSAPEIARGSWNAGWREIGEQRCYFRSTWEANYGRLLEFLRVEGKILSWEHEPQTFWFEGIKRGSMSYLPDFRVVGLDGSVTYHEVKGWMDDRSATKIARMAKYFPEVALVVVDKDQYRVMRNTYAFVIEGWERKPKSQRQSPARPHKRKVRGDVFPQIGSTP